MASRRMTVDIELLEDILEYLRALPFLPNSVSDFADGYKLHNPNVNVLGFTFGVPTHYHQHARKRARSESDSASVPPAKRLSGAAAAAAAAPQAGSSAAAAAAAAPQAGSSAASQAAHNAALAAAAASDDTDATIDADATDDADASDAADAPAAAGPQADLRPLCRRLIPSLADLVSTFAGHPVVVPRKVNPAAQSSLKKMKKALDKNYMQKLHEMEKADQTRVCHDVIRTFLLIIVMTMITTTTTTITIVCADNVIIV